jgi:hypothetical protein
VIAKGGVFTGSVARTGEASASVATKSASAGGSRPSESTISDRSSASRASAQLADVARSTAPSRGDGSASEKDLLSTKDRSRAKEVPLA